MLIHFDGWVTNANNLVSVSEASGNAYKASVNMVDGSVSMLEVTALPSESAFVFS